MSARTLEQRAAWERRSAALEQKHTASRRVKDIERFKALLYKHRDSYTDEVATKFIQVKNRDLWALQDVIAEQQCFIEELIDLIRSVSDDVAGLSGEVAKRKALIYRGVHVGGEVYDTGDMVTYAGGIWHCNEITEARPGDGNPAWTLAVKKGRDAKGVTRATA